MVMLNDAADILLVDDEDTMRRLLARRLSRAGYRVACAQDAERAQLLLERTYFHVLVTDVRLPGMTGLELARWTRQSCPATQVVLITGYANLDSAVRAVRCEACDYLEKPFQAGQLLLAVRRAVLRATRPPRVLVVDRNAAVRLAFRALLTSISVEMVGESETLDAAVPLVERLRPEVVLLEVTPAVSANLDRLRELKGPAGPAVVLLSNYEDPQLLARGLSCGADGFLYKNAGAGLLKTAILASLRGGITVDAGLLRRLVRSLSDAS